MSTAEDTQPSATSAWREALWDVLEKGRLAEPESPGSAWKGRACRELLAYQSSVPMTRPWVASHPPTWRAPRRFTSAEAAWILSGDNRVTTIAPFSKKIKQFSDDGQRFFGAYGPRYVSQLSHVVRTLLADPESRQAVIQVWRESPPETRDTPCTISWQYLMREGELHCVATMRSSDLITGWPSDVHSFSMTAAGVLLELRRASTFWRDIKLGELALTAGSQHLYRIDFEVAERVLALPAPAEPPPFVVDRFDSLDDLVRYLWQEASLSPELFA